MLAVAAWLTRRRIRLHYFNSIVQRGAAILKEVDQPKFAIQPLGDAL
jgi:hypothetical protein